MPEETPYKYFGNLAGEIPEIPADSIISRTIYKDDQVNVVLFGFAPGQELSEHTASQPALLYFVEGQATLTLDEDVLEAGPGTWTRMPPRMAHRILARSKLVMLLILLRS